MRLTDRHDHLGQDVATDGDQAKDVLGRGQHAHVGAKQRPGGTGRSDPDSCRRIGCDPTSDEDPFRASQDRSAGARRQSRVRAAIEDDIVSRATTSTSVMGGRSTLPWPLPRYPEMFSPAPEYVLAAAPGREM